MLARWITPSTVSVLALASITGNLLLAYSQHPAALAAWPIAIVHLLAFLASGVLCLEVAQDHDEPLMRRAWFLFSGEAFAVAANFLVGTPAAGEWMGITLRANVGFAFVQAGLACLLGGMFATWWQLRALGLGFRILRRDYFAVGGVLFAMLVFFGLSYAGGWMRPLMASARILLFLSVAVGVLLNRYCAQMGGGQIGLVIRFIILYAGTRCLMNVIFAINQTYAPYLLFPEQLLNLVFPWILLYGVAVRAQVTVTSSRELHRLLAESAG